MGVQSATTLSSSDVQWFSFWSKMQNCFEKKKKQKTQAPPDRPVIKRWDRAYGLTLSLATLTGLCCYVHPKNSWINAEVTTDSTLF